MNPETMNKIIKAVEHAKAKHPYFCENLPHAVSLATEELGELAKAVNDGKQAEIEAEALDTIAVLVRMIELVNDLSEPERIELYPEHLR